MNEPPIFERVALDRLFEAAENIRNVFGPLQGTHLSNAAIDMAELSAREDLKAIYLNMFALADAELKSKSNSSSHFFLSTISYEFEEIAHSAAEIPFSKRNENNFLEITELILRFFSTEGKTKKDLFYYLRGITSVNLRQKLDEISKAEKKLLSFVHTAVTRHIKADPRYRRNINTVTDLEALEKSTWRQATEEEIVAGCAPLLRGSDKPGRVVGIIFDWLLGMDKYGSGLHISVLRNAVFEMISTRFIPSSKDSTRIDPMQEYLQKEMLLLAREALEETMVTYGWRKGGSAEFRDEYERAGWDMLEESIVHGKKPRHHEALGRHIKGCDVETYRKKHMGSFQNFWKALWDTFLKKIRADI